MPEEIGSAIKNISTPDRSFSTISKPGAPINKMLSSQRMGDPAATNLQKTPNKIATEEPTKEKKNGVSKKLIMILGIISLIIFIVAAILGIFWNKIFG